MKSLLFLATMLMVSFSANAARPPNPTLALSDQVTNSESYLRQVSTKVLIGNDSTAVKWCLSQTQSTAPSSSSSTCVGGQGPSNGWYNSRPTSFNVSSGNGNKKVYVWVANSGRTVNLGPVSDQIVLDTTAPVNQSVTLSDQLTGSVTKTNNPLVNVSVLDDSSSVSWCLLEQSSLSPNPANPLFNDACWVSVKPNSVTLGATGSRTVYLYSKDVAENVSSPVMGTISYSTASPQDPSLSLANSSGYSKSPTVSVSVSNDASATKWCLSESQSTKPQFGTSQCLGGNGAINGWLTSQPTSLVLSSQDGQKTVYLWVSDSYNNVNQNSVSSLITLDTVSPVLTLGSVSPQQGLNNSNNVSVSFSVSEQSSVYCSLDNAPQVLCQSPFVATNLSEGSHSVYLYAVDSAQNTSQLSVLDWTMDLTAPTVSLSASDTNNPTTSVQNTFSFSANEAVTYECRNDSSEWASCTSPVSLQNLSDGLHSFELKGTDLAGNLSQTASYNWTVDTNVPVVLSLLSPSTNLNRSRTPILAVSGVKDGSVVSIYSDLDCLTKLSEATATSTNVNVTVPVTYGSYDFTYTVSGSKSVACSNSGVHYTADYLTGAGFPLAGDGSFLDGVWGIAIDSSNNIYTTARTENRVKKFNSAGTMTLSFGSAGAGNGEFSGLQGVATDSLGNIYTLETCMSGNCRVQKFDQTGNYLAQGGSFGFMPGQFFLAYAITVDSNNQVYVTDSINANVSVFDSDLNYLFTFSWFGSGDGELNFPTGIYAKGTNIYVMDSGNTRVQKFDSAGNFVAVSVNGYPEADINGNTAASGIFVDNSNNLYLVDYYKSRVMKFNSLGSLQMTFGSAGSLDGQLNTPFGIVVDSTGNIFVSDSINKSVQKFSPTGTVLHD